MPAKRDDRFGEGEPRRGEGPSRGGNTGGRPGGQGAPRASMGGATAAGSTPNAANESQSAMGRINRMSSDVSDAAHHYYDEARDMAGHYYDEARDMAGRAGQGVSQSIDRYPATSMMLALGVGFGVGFLLANAFTARDESWWDRHAPSSIQDWPASVRDLPDRVAKRVREMI